MAAFLDGCRFNPTAGGTTDWTYSSAVTGYQSPAAAGVVNGTLYKYRAESADLSQWEFGEGAYNTSTGILVRTTVLFNSSGTGTGSGQSGAGTRISFTAVPQVAVVALAEDIANRTLNLSDLSSAVAARTNLGAVGAIRVHKFTASGTYTPDPHLLYAVIEVVGGGGGGGGALCTTTASMYAGGGGGSGAYSRKTVAVATVGASQTVTIGAGGAGGASTVNGTGGGATSVGSLCSAGGGGGGYYGSSGQQGSGGNPGGSGGTGDVAAAGNPGSFGLYYPSIGGVYAQSGQGGSSAFGGGGLGQISSSSANNGAAAGNYGAGGSGAIVNALAASAAGGSGSAGIAIITEFCSQ